MSRVHMTEKEARRAGLIAPKSKEGRAPIPNTKTPMRCVTCGETFTGETGEARHTAEARHYRYEMVL